MKITIKEIDIGSIADYDKVEMCIEIDSILEPENCSNEAWGITFREVLVKHKSKDFRLSSSIVEVAKAFDTSNWAFFGAFADDELIGGAVVAGRTPELRLLNGRSDLALLWDIRVANAYKGQGIGAKLFEQAIVWARSKGYRQLKIESQNNNLAAFHFYTKMGGVIGGFDRFAYSDDPDPDIAQEIAFYWYLDIKSI